MLVSSHPVGGRSGVVLWSQPQRMGRQGRKVGEAQMLLLSRRYRPDPIARLPLQRAGQGLSRDG